MDPRSVFALRQRTDDIHQYGARETDMLKRQVVLVASALAMSVICSVASAQEPWKMGSVMQPPSLGATLDDELAAALSAGSAGKVVIERQFVGNEQEMVQQVIRGRLQMGVTSAFGLGVAVPDGTVMSLPYIWSSDAERRYVTDSHAFPVLKKLYAAKGLEVIALHEAGYNGVFCKSDCSSPASIKAMKARVSPNVAAKTFWGALGANGVQLPLSELWPGLEQNLVLAGDLPFPFYATTPGAQSAPYFVTTQHLHHPWIYFANKAAWDALPADTRRAMLAALPDANKVRDRWFADESTKVAAFTAKGGKFMRLTDAQRAEWQKTVVPALPPLIETLGGGAKELYQAIEVGKAEFAKRK